MVAFSDFKDRGSQLICLCFYLRKSLVKSEQFFVAESSDCVFLTLLSKFEMCFNQS